MNNGNVINNNNNLGIAGPKTELTNPKETNNILMQTQSNVQQQNVMQNLGIPVVLNNNNNNNQSINQQQVHIIFPK